MAVIREAGSIFLTYLRIFATFFKLLLCGLAMNLAIRIVVDFNVKSNKLLTLLLALNNIVEHAKNHLFVSPLRKHWGQRHEPLILNSIFLSHLLLQSTIECIVEK